jgi:hypothetical protein
VTQGGWRFQRSGFRCQDICRRLYVIRYVLVLELVLEKRMFMIRMLWLTTEDEYENEHDDEGR